MVNSAKFAHRVDKILKEYELSAATFADKIHVGRATISHILSGRNKPSLDFVMKVIHAFPQVDLYWLLEGKGSFPKIEISSTSSPTQIPKSNFEKTITSKTDLKNDTSKAIQHIVDQKKNKGTIKRIIIFMEDGTFENYEL
ncbi:helix-turn-helix transcriptional regulator [Dokdonia sp.]|uniref:helix-turn-helix transcriptional regulator n=1 Tax=Dokdonia sp. TaxID=2024995 RepID=UPI0032664F4E